MLRETDAWKQWYQRRVREGEDRMDTTTFSTQDLENQISKLRRSKLLVEKRLGDLEAREQVQEGTNKRRRDEDEDDHSSKKLRSVVSLVRHENDRSPSPPKKERPTLRSTKEDVARNRRMLGVLQGTLTKFQVDKLNEEKTERIQERLKVEKVINNRLDSDRERIRNQEREKLKKEKEECLAEFKKLQDSFETKCNQLKELRRQQQEALLSHFGKTKTTPQLYFLPAKLDDWTEKEFGIKLPNCGGQEGDHGVTDEDTLKVHVITGADEINADTKETLIVEIKQDENQEGSTPLVRKEDNIQKDVEVVEEKERNGQKEEE
eukprot:TRINITY_DN3797_c0_g1_i5.p1 TRINITY_DN3797_c0_g1~~TRINITY_DN3797_c0_g1_i5.p1  ORF type:complete len:320 (+),score=97.97 TRINITY_DN3797_c0_g1_i5:1-960(+)